MKISQNMLFLGKIHQKLCHNASPGIPKEMVKSLKSPQLAPRSAFFPLYGNQPQKY